jgi:hypothetical protein
MTKRDKKKGRPILEALRIVVHYPLGGASLYHDHYAWRSPSRKHFVFVTNRNGQSGRQNAILHNDDAMPVSAKNSSLETLCH